MIYAPLFAAVSRVNDTQESGSPIWDFIRDEDQLAKQFGDRFAYLALDDPTSLAAIAICDPMVVAEQALAIGRDRTRRDTSGVIVAMILCRPTLWVISNKPEKDRFRRGGFETIGSLPHLTQHKRPVNMDNVATYSNCTASMIIDFMSNGTRCFWKTTAVSEIQLGKEHELIRPRTDAAPEAKGADSRADYPDHVITCDGLIAARLRPRTGSDNHRCVFSWHRSSVVPDFPFTAVVCRRAWLKSLRNRLQLRALLRELQASVTKMQPDATRSDFQAEVDVAMREFARIGAPEMLEHGKLRNAGTDFDNYKDYSLRCVEELQSSSTETGRSVCAYPRRVCPEWTFPWLQRGWHFSFNQLWNLWPGSTSNDSKQTFARCSTALLAPRNALLRFKSYFSNAADMLLSLNALVAAFLGALIFAIGFAYFEQTRTPNVPLSMTPLCIVQTHPLPLPMVGPIDDSSDVSLAHDLTAYRCPEAAPSDLKSLWFPPDSVATGLALLAWAFMVYPMWSAASARKTLWWPRLVDRRA